MTMKLKTISGIMLTLSLVIMLFAVPIKSSPATIKIGVLGPLAWPVGESHYEAAHLAAEEINDAGGILGNTVEIVFADTLRGQLDPTSTTGTSAMMELMAGDVDFTVGTFRSEAAFGAREVAMDYKRFFFISGAGTSHLVTCASQVYLGVCTGPSFGAPCGYTGMGACQAAEAGTTACTTCTTSNYARYKYVFRNTPMNSSTLLRSIVGHYLEGKVGFVQWVLATKLVPIYGKFLWYSAPGVPGNHPVFGVPVPQVKVAVLIESAVWADLFWTYLTELPYYAIVMGPYANVTYATRISPYATDVSAEITAAVASGARIIIQALSGPVGRAFTTQWADLGSDAVPIGINVPGGEIGPPSHWELTLGKAQYESFLWTSGERTALTDKTIPFWDAYLGRWGHAPMYTGFGTYDSIYGIKEAIETLGYFYHGNQTYYDELIPVFEATDRVGVVGNFKYTGPSGTWHDLWTVDIGDTWPSGYVRAMVNQWQYNIAEDRPKLEVVFPRDRAFSKRWEIPPSMYDHADTDFAPVDGLVDINDLGAAGVLWLSAPTKDLLEADQDSNYFINIYDLSYIAKDYGYNATAAGLPFPFGDYTDP